MKYIKEEIIGGIMTVGGGSYIIIEPFGLSIDFALVSKNSGNKYDSMSYSMEYFNKNVEQESWKFEPKKEIVYEIY